LNIILDAIKQTLVEKHIAIARTVVETLDNTPGPITTEKLLHISEPLDIIELSVANSNGIIIASNVPKYIGFDYKLYEPTKVYMKLTDGAMTVLSEERRRDGFGCKNRWAIFGDIGEK